MAGHEQKHCARCNKLFECKAGNISQCDCAGIQLNKETAEWIKHKYQDCLCIKCLSELSNPADLFMEKYKNPAN